MRGLHTRRVLREGRWLPLRPAVADPPAQSLDGVLVDQVAHSQSAVLGPALLAYHARQELGLSAVLSGLGFNPPISHFPVQSADFQSAFSVIASAKPTASRRSRMLAFCAVREISGLEHFK